MAPRLPSGAGSGTGRGRAARATRRRFSLLCSRVIPFRLCERSSLAAIKTLEGPASFPTRASRRPGGRQTAPPLPVGLAPREDQVVDAVCLAAGGDVDRPGHALEEACPLLDGDD